MGCTTIRCLHHCVLSQLVLRHIPATDSQHMFLHVLFCGALLFWRLLLEDKKNDWPTQFDVVSPEIHHDLEHKRLRCANDFTYRRK